MTPRAAFIVVLLLAAAMGALAVWGRNRPLVVVERPILTSADRLCPECRGTRRVACRACEGAGWIAGAEMTCRHCGGSGRTDGGTLLRRSRPDRQLGAPVPCPVCQGRGRVAGGRTQCPGCGGTGRMPCPACAGTGGDVSSPPATRRTVREECSAWERFWSWFGFPPDPNPPPQRKPDGSVPIVERYLLLFSAPGRSARVLRWGEAHFTSGGWEIPARVRFMEGTNQREEGRWFRIEQREIVGSRPVAFE